MREHSITERQQEVLDFIREFRARHDRSPTFLELAIGLKVSSKGTISHYLDRLEHYGAIKRTADTRCVIEVTGVI